MNRRIMGSTMRERAGFALSSLGALAGPAIAGDKNNGDLNTTYLAVHSVSLKDGGGDFSEFDELLNEFRTEQNPDGYGNPNGFVRFGLHYHFNPVSDKLFKLREGATPPYKYGDFRFRPGVVARNLSEAAALYPDAHITISIMAGHCYESVFSEFLNQNPERNFMRNQYDQPVEFNPDEDCASIYPFTPPLLDGHKNFYAQALHDNTRKIMEEISAWADANPNTVIAGIGLGGPTIYPRGVGNKKADTRWADYRDDFLEGFRRYAEAAYAGDFAAFMQDMGLADGTFADFSEIDPPRFDPLSVNLDCTEHMPGCQSRGYWDTLGDLDNPYFAFWYEYRAYEISAHYATFSQLAAETGLDGYYLYSHQGVAWEDADSYLVKGSSLSTIDPTLTGLQPGINMYDEKTSDYDRIREVGVLARKAGSRAGAASFQYNPGGPCEIIKHEDGSKERVCTPEGYPVREYLERLHFTAGTGDDPRRSGNFRLLMVMGDDKEGEDAIRTNMRKAMKAYLSNEFYVESEGEGNAAGR